MLRSAAPEDSRECLAAGRTPDPSRCHELEQAQQPRYGPSSRVFVPRPGTSRGRAALFQSTCKVVFRDVVLCNLAYSVFDNLEFSAFTMTKTHLHFDVHHSLSLTISEHKEESPLPLLSFSAHSVDRGISDAIVSRTTTVQEYVYYSIRVLLNQCSCFQLASSNLSYDSTLKLRFRCRTLEPAFLTPKALLHVRRTEIKFCFPWMPSIAFLHSCNDVV